MKFVNLVQHTSMTYKQSYCTFCKVTLDRSQDKTAVYERTYSTVTPVVFGSTAAWDRKLLLHPLSRAPSNRVFARKQPQQTAAWNRIGFHNACSDRATNPEVLGSDASHPVDSGVLRPCSDTWDKP